MTKRATEQEEEHIEPDGALTHPEEIRRAAQLTSAEGRLQAAIRITQQA